MLVGRLSLERASFCLSSTLANIADEGGSQYVHTIYP